MDTEDCKQFEESNIWEIQITYSECFVGAKNIRRRNLV